MLPSDFDVARPLTWSNVASRLGIAAPRGIAARIARGSAAAKEIAAFFAGRDLAGFRAGAGEVAASTRTIEYTRFGAIAFNIATATWARHRAGCIVRSAFQGASRLTRACAREIAIGAIAYARCPHAVHGSTAATRGDEHLHHCEGTQDHPMTKLHRNSSGGEIRRPSW